MLQVGFSRIDITPPMGIGVAGYYRKRRAGKVLDPLYANAVAFSDGETQVLLISCDLLGIRAADALPYRRQIAGATGVPAEAVFLTCTHTHTGPAVHRAMDDDSDLVHLYEDVLGTKLADVCRAALCDLHPAQISGNVSHAPRISFVRRYRMKDGSIRTNPGVNHPDIVEPVGTADDTVTLIRIARENAPEVDLVGFQVHPDTVGGCDISGDWPRFVRDTMENTFPGSVCVCLNGTAGDLNHVNVQPRPGELNEMFHDFDDVWRGYAHAKHMGRSIAAAAMGIYGKCVKAADGKLRYASLDVTHASHREPEQTDWARHVTELHESGRDAELPYEGMGLTTAVAGAARILRLENAPETFTLPVSGFSAGEFAFAGFPGEPFNAVGQAVRAASPFPCTLISCLTNGMEGYFPMQENYDQGGYEAASSNFAPGIAEALQNGSLRLLAGLKG